MALRVFICWSGERSRHYAKALEGWLPLVLPPLDLFVSDGGIGAGNLWDTQLLDRLHDSDFGIACLTPDNVTSPWINFEAGAIAIATKAKGEVHVAPLLIGMQRGDLQGAHARFVTPLSQLQLTEVNKDGILGLLKTMNKLLDEPDDVHMLQKRLEDCWHRLESKIEKIEQQFARPDATTREPSQTARESREMLQELESTSMPMSAPLPSMTDASEGMEAALDIGDSTQFVSALKDWIHTRGGKFEFTREFTRVVTDGGIHQTQTTRVVGESYPGKAAPQGDGETSRQHGS